MQKETVDNNGNQNKMKIKIKIKTISIQKQFQPSIYHLRTFVGKYSSISSM